MMALFSVKKLRQIPSYFENQEKQAFFQSHFDLAKIRDDVTVLYKVIYDIFL